MTVKNSFLSLPQNPSFVKSTSLKNSLRQLLPLTLLSLLPLLASAQAPRRPRANPANPAQARVADNAFEEGSNVVNLGIGLGNRYSYGVGTGSSSVSPALSLSYERGVAALGPGVLGVGVFAGYQGASYDLGSGNKYKYTDVIVMLRGAFHYPVSPQFDAYGGLGLGIRSAGVSYEGKALGGAGAVSANGLASGLFLGGRYYFGSGIGAFAELGYDQTFLKVGLAARF